MADISDVENAIVGVVLAALYPNGLSHTSAVGATCRVYRGWPAPSGLNSDLAAGIANVTVFPASASGEVPDVYFNEPSFNISPTTWIATVTAQDVAISGTAGGTQIIGLLIDGVPFSYRTSGNDTTDSIAANLSMLINVNRICVLSGSTLTLPGARSLIARVAANATVTNGVRRQRREIQIISWCPSPGLRDSLCKIVDIALATSPFIELSDTTVAHGHYVSTHVYDQSQNALLYRRDLCYRYEYTTIDSVAAPVMLFGDLVNNTESSFV
jgi:hypothetical protein